mgnify:CR=1 FL=1
MKHNWNNLDNYLSVHANIMHKYFQIYPQFERISHNRIMLRYNALNLTTIKNTNIEIYVLKTAAINQVNNMEIARTIEYRYHAKFQNGGNILRYCSPHDHRPYHHKHIYSQNVKTTVTIPDDTWPHFSEFLDEIINTY